MRISYEPVFVLETLQSNIVVTLQVSKFDFTFRLECFNEATTDDNGEYVNSNNTKKNYCIDIDSENQHVYTNPHCTVTHPDGTFFTRKEMDENTAM